MNFWKKRFSRIISFLMANIMLLTVMPTELMADVLYSENAAVSVSWKPRENQVLFGGKGIIDLSVGVDTEKIQSAQVKISLTEKEAESFTQFEEINGVKHFQKTEEHGKLFKMMTTVTNIFLQRMI